jgi:outer membrane protein OmpA-like peptidoglycan-associated protein
VKPRTVCARAATLSALLCLSSCGFLSAPQAAHHGELTLPAPRPAVLIVITDPDSAAALKETTSLVAATARAGERVIILGDQTGATVATSTAPPPPAIPLPAPPAPLSPGSTKFQSARYATALRQYRAAVAKANAQVRQLQRSQLATWARTIIPGAHAQLVTRRDQGADIAATLGAAAADLSSLRQAGVGGAATAVIAIVGVSQDAWRSAPATPTGLLASTVVVDGFPADNAVEAAWQDSFLQAGAGRVVLLTPAIDDQFAPLVRQALDGAITDTLTNVLFSLGQYRLSTAAGPQLRRLLRLLTVKYPDATATIVGYTDDLPTPGGNQRLSQLRAQAVAQWLVARGVASSRLQTFGDGDADPVAPNTSAGQPLDRRVDVVIDPAAVKRR